MSGWSELGAALAGGGGAAQRAYDTGMLQGSRQAGLLEDARMKRDKNMGLEAITPQLLGSVASGRDPITGEAFAPEAADSLQGQLLNGLLHAGIDPRQFSGYQKDQQGIGFGNRAMEVATAPHPDLNLLNRLNMVREGKPVDLSTIKDGTLLSAMVTPDQQAAVGGNTPTDVGLASIMLKGAQADASRAQAANSYAHAKVAGQGGGFGRAPSGYRFTADGNLEPIAGGPADSSGSGQGLSADAIDNAAWAYVGTGKLPAVGRGKEGVAQRTAVMNRTAEIAKAAGVSPAELQTVPGRNRALQSSLTNLQKISDVMEKSEVAFQNNTKVAMDLSENLSRTGSPALNKWILGAKSQMGDPDVQALDAAITTMAVDYARIMSGATGAGGTPISTAEEAKSLIRKELSHKSLAAVVDVLDRDIAGQQAAVHAQRGKIISGMQQMRDQSTVEGGLHDAMVAPSAGGAAPSVPRPATQADFNALPSGAIYIDPDDGQTYRKP